LNKNGTGTGAFLLSGCTDELRREQARVLRVNLIHGQREHVTIPSAYKVRILRDLLAIPHPNKAYRVHVRLSGTL